MERVDVLVVGGGPAGSSLAWGLRSSGRPSNTSPLQGMPSAISPLGTAAIRCAKISGTRWLTTGTPKASAMPATLRNGVMPPTRIRSTIRMSTARACSSRSSGAMP